MSKQSNLKEQELKRLKAEAKLFKAQQDGQNQNAESHTESKNRKKNPETNPIVLFTERPGFIALIATLFGVLAAFAFPYNHTCSIWLLFIFLFTCGHWLRVELKLHPKKSKFSPNFWGLMFWAASLCVCSSLQLLEMANSRIISASAQPPRPTIEDQINMTAQLARARHWEPPEFPSGARGVWLTLGGNFRQFFATDHLQNRVPVILFPGGDIVLPYLTNNRIYVQAQLPFGGPETTVKMNNEWPINIPSGWDRNFDSRKFEIVDERTNPVFQINYESPIEIYVNGVFVSENGAISIAFDGIEVSTPGTPVSSIPKAKPWFKYPSERFLGKAADK